MPQCYVVGQDSFAGVAFGFAGIASRLRMRAIAKSRIVMVMPKSIPHSRSPSPGETQKNAPTDEASRSRKTKDPDGPSTSRSHLEEMPPELLGLIASKLPPRGRIALALTSKAINSGLETEARAAAIVANASKVKTLAKFNELLGSPHDSGVPARQSARSIQELPKSLQGEPLVALGASVLGLPRREQQLARDGFLEVARNYTGARPALLDEIEHAAASGRAAMEDRADAAIDGPAGAAVRAGDNVQDVTQQYGISHSKGISRLERAAIEGRAGEVVRAGENVQDVVQTHGFSHPEGIYHLERAAVKGRAADAVRNGENVQTVAERHGIGGSAAIVELELEAVKGAAGHAVQAGQNVQDVAQRHGIRYGGALNKLEQMASSLRSDPSDLAPGIRIP